MEELDRIREELMDISYKEAIRLFRIGRKAAAHGCNKEVVQKIQEEARWLYETGMAYPDRLLQEDVLRTMHYAFK